MINTISKILGIHRNSYFNWKKQERPIISLLEKYFTKEDLEEFLNTNEISKMKYLNHYEEILNIEFITFYREKFDTGENAKKFNELFWNFISLYKNKLISQNNENFKVNKIILNELLLDYYTLLIDENKQTNKYPDEYIKSKVSHFITIMQEPSVELVNFIITNIELDFVQIINYLRTNKLDSFANEIEEAVAK